MLHIPKVFALIEEKVSVCEQKNLHLVLTTDQTYKTVIKSTLLYLYTTMSLDKQFTFTIN